MITVGLFGANGFVGEKLHQSLAIKGYKVTAINRDNYKDNIGKFYNIVINSAMPSSRFWAKNNPGSDFEETVKKTSDIFYGCTFDKFVQISSVSARCQFDTVYGRHKLAAEKICHSNNNLIFRLTAMFSKDLKKGFLVDIAKGQKVFVDENSRYSFASIDFITDYISSNLDKTGIIEVGARNSVRLIDIAKNIGKTIDFEGPLDIQVVENDDLGLPDSNEVFVFMKNYNINF